MYREPVASGEDKSNEPALTFRIMSAEMLCEADVGRRSHTGRGCARRGPAACRGVLDGIPLMTSTPG